MTSAATRLRVGHIATLISEKFADDLELTYVKDSAEQQRVMTTQTRGLAALALNVLVPDLEPADCSRRVTDGTDDNGIDALYVDKNEKRIYVVQSKWSDSGTGGIAVGDMHKTIKGIRDLTDERFDRFNKKFDPFLSDVEAALGDPQVTFTLVIATTGTSTLDSHAQQAVDDLLTEMNDISDMLTVRVLGLAELHAVVREGGKPPKIDLEVALEDWGTVKDPFDAYYGLIDGSTLAQWYASYGGQLFDDNLRKALGATVVNDAIIDTLKTNPERFCYYNNGVTALCDSVTKTPRGGASRLSGDFAVTGLRIVNGAQTVSSLAARAKEEPQGLDSVRVWIRLISLDRCPDGFATEVTRATNTQNTVEARDFLSLDPTQVRLQDDMRLSLNKAYVFKRGEPTPEPEAGCTVSEAIVALACANKDSSFAVIAKSAVGRLEAPTGRFYPQMFNERTTAHQVWQSVQLHRAIESALLGLRRESEGKRRAICQQGNRMIAHVVLRRIQETHKLDEAIDATAWADLLSQVPALSTTALDEVLDQIEAKFASNYVTSLFKNANRCQAIARALLA